MQPSTAQSTPATNAGGKMKFGKVELELLSQVNEIDKNFQKEGLVYEDKDFTPYLEQLGKSLLTPEDLQLENVNWRFRVFRNPLVNAFALPNGSIYINSGLLGVLDDESQLASVLAHEIIHVRNRHTYLEYLDARKKMIAIHVIMAVEAYAGVPGATLATSQILSLTALGYSRKLEKEADLEGLQYVMHANYNPNGMKQIFEYFLRDIEVPLHGEGPLLYSNHPHLKDRIVYVGEAIEKNPPKKNPTAEDEAAQKNRFLQISESVKRHNVTLSIEKGLYRMAVYSAKRNYDFNPKAVENVVNLAAAYFALGARTPEPTTDELSGKGKKETRRLKSKLTLDEEDKTLAATSAGKEQQQKNYIESERRFQEALQLAPDNADIYRGLGELLSKTEKASEAITAYRKYLELRPDAFDRLMITYRLKTLETQAASQPAQKN